MVFMLYGVVNDPAVVAAPMTGMKGREVSFVTGHGLCAAVSEMADAGSAPPVAELLVYCRVVESLHLRQATVPMRYGCFLSDTEAIRRALQERQEQYKILLAQLEGHVEMGIRLLLSGQEERSRRTRPMDEHLVDGRNYLAIRKVHYRTQDETVQDSRALIDDWLHAFAGLFAKHRTETDSKSGAVILSLYFLTPANKVNRFRETFGRVAQNGRAKALLSGPWPPYNFVTPDLAAVRPPA